MASQQRLEQQQQMELLEVCCRDHPNATLIEDYRTGDQICRECGLVVGDRVIDAGSEWRTFSNERGSADPSRVGGAENPLLNGGDLTTMISGGHGDAAFDEFGVAKYQNHRSVSSNDRTLMSAFKAITQMSDRLSLPKTVVDRANNVFTTISEKKTVKGKSNDGVAAASLYIACRLENIPRTFKEICTVAKSSKKDISRCYKYVASEMKTQMDSITTDDFMSRFCANLKLPFEVEKAAGAIARNAIRLDVVPGRSPISVTAAAIYMASQASSFKRTQKEIGLVAGVADVTIRQAYKLIYAKAEVLFPKDFKFDTAIDQLPLV